MHDATRRVPQWIIGVRGEVPLVETLAPAEDVHRFVCGHVRWLDGTPGPAIELEDLDCTTVDWHAVLKIMLPPCSGASSIALMDCDLSMLTDVAHPLPDTFGKIRAFP